MGFLEFKVYDNFTEEILKKLGKAGTKAEHKLAVQIAKDTEQYVPARTKLLTNRTQINGGLIIYFGPYARFLYYGKLMIDPNTGSAWARKGATKIVTGKDLNIKTDVHSNAQAFWFEASKAQNLDKWVRIAGKDFINELNK